jgi:hypothetical protein
MREAEWVVAADKLAELHGIHLARETLRQWMIAGGRRGHKNHMFKVG